jgi:putative membrane protein
MKRLKHYWENHQDFVVLGVIAFLAFAGVVQYALGLRYVLSLMPLVPALLAGFALLYWPQAPKRKITLFAVAFMIGYVLELIGVKTGIIFGDYQYTGSLGIKLFDVPLAIGLTWFLVTISAWHIVSLAKWTKTQMVIVAAGLCVMFDLILEQFATGFGLWSWQGGVIPLLNYITWFFVALIIVTIFAKWDKPKRQSLAVALLLPLMAIFFWLMLLTKA